MGIMKAWASGQIDCDDMKQRIWFPPLMILNRHSAAGFANTTYQERRRKDTERFGVFGLLRKYQVLMHGHIPAAVLLLLMVIRIVAVRDAFLLDLRTEFAVNMREPCAALRQGVVLEDICHVMEQPRHRKEYLRRCRSALPFQKALRIEEARRLKDTVRDMLFDALNEADISNEDFERSISSERLYICCGVTRKTKPRGRPRKGGGDA